MNGGTERTYIRGNRSMVLMMMMMLVEVLVIF